MQWSRSFIITLIIFSLIVGFFDFYAWSWLQSIGSPLAALEGYAYYSDLAWTSLWISALILLVHANIAFAKQNRPWFFWATFAYFCFFVILKYFWLALAEFDFRQSNNIEQAGTLIGPFVAVFLFVFVGGLIFANHFLAVRLSERIYPSPAKSRENEKSMNEKASTGDTQDDV
ncbi:MAG TPA: hypothetical protein PKD24_04515 [Pyrinomonadaceae bacterium]|nr:hypothetical protein [Pyrinomonadaceae bacterium]HMP64815.1 hypothetical protein [Pyrinomonadaceae bacterium]